MSPLQRQGMFNHAAHDAVTLGVKLYHTAARARLWPPRRVRSNAIRAAPLWKLQKRRGAYSRCRRCRA